MVKHLSFDDMIYSYQCPNELQILPRHWQAKRYWISWDFQKLKLLENNPNNVRSIMKSQIKNKKNKGKSLWNLQYNANIKNFHGVKLIWAKKLWGGYSKWEDYWSNHAKIGEQFHNDKCIFQKSEHCKSSLED